MKKLLSLFVVAALTLGGLTSCAKQEEKNDSGKKPVKSTAAGKSCLLYTSDAADE